MDKRCAHSMTLAAHLFQTCCHNSSQMSWLSAQRQTQTSSDYCDTAMAANRRTDRSSVLEIEALYVHSLL